jgi:hypothetical protein
MTVASRMAISHWFGIQPASTQSNDGNEGTTMRFLFAAALLFALACDAFQAKEPKQREDWVSPPMKYGDTQFNGLEAPGHGHGADAGPNNAP